MGCCKNTFSDPDKIKRHASCLALCISCLCTIASFVLVVLVWVFTKRLRNGYDSFVDPWNRDAVFGISSASANPPSYPSSKYYLDPIVGRWPGTKPGCYCSAANEAEEVEDSVRGGLKTRECDLNETRAGCKDIKETKPLNLTRWGNSVSQQMVKANGTSFLELYKQMKEDGSCESGYFHCGNPNSISKGICIPNSLVSCPITFLKNSVDSNFKQEPSFSNQIYSTNKPDNNTISDMVIELDHACFIRSHFPLPPSVSKYPLFYGEFDYCEADKKPFIIEEISETTFLTSNGIRYSLLTDFKPSSGSYYRLMGKRNLEWSPSCKETVGPLAAKSEYLAKTYNQTLILFIIFIISLTPLVLNSLNFVCGVYKTHSKSCFKASFVLRSLCFLLLLPSFIIVMARLHSLHSFMGNIGDLNCTDEESANQYKKIADNLKKVSINLMDISFTLYILSYVLDVIVSYVFVKYYKIVPKDPVVPSLPGDGGSLPKQQGDEVDEIFRDKNHPQNTPEEKNDISIRDPNERLNHGSGIEFSQQNYPAVPQYLQTTHINVQQNPYNNNSTSNNQYTNPHVGGVQNHHRGTDIRSFNSNTLPFAPNQLAPSPYDVYPAPVLQQPSANQGPFGQAYRPNNIY